MQAVAILCSGIVAFKETSHGFCVILFFLFYRHILPSKLDFWQTYAAYAHSRLCMFECMNIQRYIAQDF